MSPNSYWVKSMLQILSEAPFCRGTWVEKAFSCVALEYVKLQHAILIIITYCRSGHIWKTVLPSDSVTPHLRCHHHYYHCHSHNHCRLLPWCGRHQMKSLWLSASYASWYPFSTFNKRLWNLDISLFFLDMVCILSTSPRMVTWILTHMRPWGPS